MKLRTLFSVQPGTLACTVLLWAATAVLLAFAAAPYRAFQLWSFSILFGGLLLYRGRSSLVKVVAYLGFLLIWIDGGIRAFLRTIYGAEPKSTFVLESVANTHTSESFEYLQTLWSDVALWSGVVLALAIAGLVLIRRIPSTPAPRTVSGKALSVLIGFLALVLTVGAALSPWRGHWPIFYWPSWVRSVESVRAGWENQTQEHDLRRATADAQVTSASKEPRTLLLLVGESMVRDNLSLYGYPRNTTPKLDALANDPHFATVRPVWSVSSSTLPAFDDMFEFSTSSGPGNLFAFFRSAGYKVTWISNQDDLAIKNRYAAWDDDPEMLNRLSGRSSASLDGNVLPSLEKALKDPAERHLIVVHLIGLHPHYRLRRPNNWKADWAKNDAVETQLKALDRSSWVIDARSDYDLGIRYQDEILARSLELARASSEGKILDWVYVSDHGQELGDDENRTGHSNTTADGYRVPLLFWLSDRSDAKDWENRPFRTDRLSPTLLALAGIRWKDEDAGRIFLDPAYVWEKPEIPVLDPELDAVTAREAERRANAAP